MSDVNASPEVPATPVEDAAVQPGESPAAAESPSAVESLLATTASSPTGEQPAPAPTVDVPATEAAPVSAHESLLARIEELPEDAAHVLHDILAHVHEGLTEVALVVGMSRLGSLLGKVRSLI